MSITSLVNRDIRLKAAAPDATRRAVSDKQGKDRDDQPRQEPPDKAGGVSGALEVLSLYFPAEVMAIYIFGLGGLKTMSDDLCGPEPGCLSLSWWILVAVCAVLVLFFSSVSWLAAQKKGGKTSYPTWPVVAALIAFAAWAMATPGNPLITSGGAATLVGFVALSSGYVLAGFELILGKVARERAK